MTSFHSCPPAADSRHTPRPLRVLLRELRADGGAGLADLDLVAVLLGPRPLGKARQAAREVLAGGDWASLVARAGRCRDAPIGNTREIRLAAALELARRVAVRAPGAPPAVCSPRDAWEMTADLRCQRREHFVALYLNVRHRLLARETISVGSLEASLVHPREVFEPAIRHGAAALVVVHNHPSGETEPSRDDLAITRRLVESGEILGIRLVDHVVVAAGGYTSLREAGHL